MGICLQLNDVSGCGGGIQIFSAGGASGKSGASAGGSAQLSPPEFVDSDLAGSSAATGLLEGVGAGFLGLAFFFFLATDLEAGLVESFLGAAAAFFVEAGLGEDFAFLAEFVLGVAPEDFWETDGAALPVGFAGRFSAASALTARA